MALKAILTDGCTWEVVDPQYVDGTLQDLRESLTEHINECNYEWVRVRSDLGLAAYVSVTAIIGVYAD